ncbi:hypothetical protein DY468_23625, partial [Rhodopseudomonas sp. BR0M22]|nr:hypothetical protein [Rhodopseudomonas sp. BR0M22]
NLHSFRRRQRQMCIRDSDNIPRRYCAGEVVLNDHTTRPVYFSIVEDGGLAGFTDGVEFCVVGLDRNWAFNPACRAAKP